MATFSVFLLILSSSLANDTINGVDNVRNDHISDNNNPQSSILSTVLLSLAIKNNNLTHKTPIKLNNSTHESTPRTGTVYHGFFCPLNETTSENNTSSFNDGAVWHLCIGPIFIKILTVVGISLASGVAVALLLPLALYLVMFAIGFTAYGIKYIVI